MILILILMMMMMMIHQASKLFVADKVENLFQNWPQINFVEIKMKRTFLLIMEMTSVLGVLLSATRMVKSLKLITTNGLMTFSEDLSLMSSQSSMPVIVLLKVCGMTAQLVIHSLKLVL